MSLKSDWGALLTRATMKERLEMVAIELDNLEQLKPLMTPDEADIFYDIEAEHYALAIRKATGNYEPPDLPGWEGGFADNH